MGNLAGGGSRGPPSAEFSCESRGRPFPKKVGLSLHRRKMLPSDYHQDAKVELEGRSLVKRRWTDSESAGLARQETRLNVSGFSGNINAELVRFTEDRSLEAIKSRRKTEKHKNLVQEFIKSENLAARLVVDLPPIAE